jgi:hypothetical protein
LRREYVSAQAPDGTSRTNAVVDQMTNRIEIWAADRPWSLNSSWYSGYSGMKSCSASYATMRLDRLFGRRSGRQRCGLVYLMS